MNKQQNKKFVFILEGNAETCRLNVDEADVIENADGEVDVPLDRVLRKHHMNIRDLFQMNVNNVSFAEEEDEGQRIIHSIPFAHLHHS